VTGDPRLRELYLEAVELDAAGRRALLARLADPELAGALARLLAHPETEPSPIDRPPALGRTSPESPVPERVGPYRLLREIGRGGMGRVFLAEQETPDFKRTVALKLIDRHSPADDAVRRFREEVRILAALDHPGIARFLDGGRSPEGIWYLALEYVEGADLVAHANRDGLDLRRRAELFVAVAQAVGYAHERGVVHRDLKPANILVGRDGRPRLLDFGISKLLDPEEPGATTTLRDGPRPLTPAYASPEQLAGAPATAASDVYSLGVTLYELLCGERPATSGTGERPAPPPSELLRRTGSARPPRRLMRALDEVCGRALRHLPEERYAEASAFALALRSALEESRVSPVRRWRGAALGLLALLAAALGVVSLRPGAAPRPAPAAASPAVRGFPFDPANPGEIALLEARFGAAPADVATGAALAIRLAKEDRMDEAAMVIGRLRQIPGKELDPLTDFAEGRIASLRKERQRALVFLTRARDNALATGRSELLAEIRGLRGTVLAALGQRDAAIAELELALADAERIGDSLRAYRTLNDLAIERLQRGELAEGQELLERALRAAERAGVQPLVALGNLAEVQTQRGRPDLAERSLAQLLELRRREPSRLREAQVELKRFEALRDLGRAAEAETALARAIDLLSTPEGDLDRAVALFLRADADLDAARFDRVDAILAAIEGVAHERLDRRALGLAHQLRAHRESLVGDASSARSEFAVSHRILTEQGDLDLAARSDLAWASAEVLAGADDEALRLLEQLDSRRRPEAAGVAFFATALRARLEAGRGAGGDAGPRLAGLAGEAQGSPSLRRQLAYSTAAAIVAASAGRPGEARRELARALDAARRTGRQVEAIALRLELAAVAGSGPGSAEVVRGLAAEAERLGLPGLSRRARDLAQRLAAAPAL
jgi:serine/threonine-protein kinase